jgi:signal transduction histidine kinase/ActR/RegA family two-component response regulator
MPPDDAAARPRRSATSLSALPAAAPGTYLVLNPALVIVAASAAYGNAGTEPAAVIGESIFDAFADHANDDAVADLRASLDRVRRDKVPDTMAIQASPVALPLAHRGQLSGGYWRPENVPVLGPDGSLAFIIHRLEEVTDQLRLAAGPGPQDANRALRSGDARTEFMDRFSRELRSPLNAILGFGELLSVDNISAEHREWVATMLRAGRQLLLLLDQVMDVSRIEAQALSLSMQAVPAQSLIADALESIRPLSLARGVLLDPPPRPDTSYYVLADEKRLRQVLLNLLSNAIKYNHPAGRVTVTVGQRPRGRLRISVIDTGRGIAQHDLDRIFVPFERLDAAQAGIEGTGLSLALSRQLVEAMGGSTGVTSTYGEGSVFWIDLPATEPVAVLQQAIERDAVVACRAYSTSKTVLYVEDMVENLLLIEQILKQRPSAVLVPAMHAVGALDLARECHPDLILLDLRLPDMPGEEVLRSLRADPATRDIPVVILSADTNQRRIDQVIADGATAYLTKPISIRSLLEVVDRALGEAPQTAGPAIGERSVPAQRPPHGYGTS